MSQPLPPELPDSAVQGDANQFFLSLREDVRPAVALAVLKLLASERRANLADGQMLMALARLEDKATAWLSPLKHTQTIREVFDTPANPVS